MGGHACDVDPQRHRWRRRRAGASRSQRRLGRVGRRTDLGLRPDQAPSDRQQRPPRRPPHGPLRRSPEAVEAGLRPCLRVGPVPAGALAQDSRHGGPAGAGAWCVVDLRIGVRAPPGGVQVVFQLPGHRSLRPLGTGALCAHPGRRSALPLLASLRPPRTDRRPRPADHRAGPGGRAGGHQFRQRRDAVRALPHRRLRRAGQRPAPEPARVSGGRAHRRSLAGICGVQ